MSDILKTPSAMISDDKENEAPSIMLERFHKARQALAALNNAGLRRGDGMPSFGPLGRFGPFANMTATTLVGALLWLSMREGFGFLHGLMDELKEARITNARSLEKIQEDRAADRLAVSKHASDASDSIRELSRELRRMQYLTKPPVITSPKKNDEDKELHNDLGFRYWDFIVPYAPIAGILKESIASPNGPSQSKQPSIVPKVAKATVSNGTSPSGIGPSQR